MPYSVKLQVVGGRAPVEPAAAADDPRWVQERWAEAFLATQTNRGYSETTVEGSAYALAQMLDRLGIWIWELESEDLDRVLTAMVVDGLAAATRRQYVAALTSFHRFVRTRHAAEVEARFGIEIRDPVDEFNTARHVSFDSPNVPAPPSTARLESFFSFLHDRVASSPRYAAAGRDYALFRLLYHAGVRVNEAIMLDVGDVHFDRGVFGKLHVRFGKGAKTSGPRPRWVPMLDGLDEILAWYLDEIRPRAHPVDEALFVDQEGGRFRPSSVRNRLAYLLGLEPDDEGRTRFSPHGLRRACATHNYERGVDLVAIQQMLGHWHIGTTMRYVLPSSNFIEDAYRRAVAEDLRQLLDSEESR